MSKINSDQEQHYSVDGSSSLTAAATSPNSPLWFDLKPDRNLLDAHFEGYKLSLNSFPQYKLDLAASEHALATYNFIDSRDSSNSRQFLLYQHLKLFGMPNLLHVNQFSQHELYYFDAAYRLIKINYANNDSSLLTTPNATRSLTATSFQLAAVTSSDRTCISMRFVSATSAFVFDGFNTLYLIQMDSNYNDNWSENWSVLYEWQTSDPQATTCVLRDAILYENVYHVLLLNVQEAATSDESTAEKFNTIINWLSISR